jgi:hypothetical protein
VLYGCIDITCVEPGEVENVERGRGVTQAVEKEE